MKQYKLPDNLKNQIITAFYELNAPVKTYDLLQKALANLEEIQQEKIDTTININNETDSQTTE